MNKITKIMKSNKYTMIGLIAFVALIIVGFIGYKVLFSGNGSPLYGNRLEGIDKVEITSEEQEKIISKIKEDDSVTKVSTNIKGKILNVIITFKKNTKLDDAKKLTSVIIENIEDDQKSYYDIQVFFKNEEEKVDGYPTIGYCGKGTDTFKYSSATYDKEEE